ncbi:hypothetical protein [Paenibacillus sp. MBLB4367]|uniref:hypothetical protein n=1 Tax=Paenibacillus sp. MBLB4367 TaxID=3384767 RepID=UPI003908073E
MQIPAHLLKDRYWRGTLHLFTKHDKLQRCMTSQYFDFDEGEIRTTGLRQLTKPWSQSERFMLELALHLFNERHLVNLHIMDYLDTRNKELAFEAIRLRFG